MHHDHGFEFPGNATRIVAGFQTGGACSRSIEKATLKKIREENMIRACECWQATSQPEDRST